MINRDPLAQYEVASASKRFKIEDENDPCAAVPDSVWNDPKVMVEKKKDGHRFKLHIFDKTNRLDSRRQSINGGLYVEKTDNVPHLRDLDLSDLSGSVLDGELVAGKDSNAVAHALGSRATDEEKANIRYIVFDALILNGVDIRQKKDEDRRALLEKFFKESKLANQKVVSLMPRPPSMTPAQKKKILLDALAEGEEGVMMKDVTKPYGKGWMKVKRRARYDVVVTGYEEPKEFSKKKGSEALTETKFFSHGWIGAIKFGQWKDGKLVEFGQASGMTDEMRREISENREKTLGRVMEIAAQGRFPTGRFRHPQFIRWRDGEKLSEDCVYDPDEV